MDLALSYSDWKKRGRGVKRGRKPFAYIDGEALWSSEDTYNLRRDYGHVSAPVRRRRRAGDYDCDYSSDDFYFAAEGTFFGF